MFTEFKVGISGLVVSNLRYAYNVIFELGYAL